MRTRIGNISLFTGGAQPQYLTDACVQIDGGAITYAGSAKDAPPFDAREVIDGRGMLCMPGLCNAHTHTPMTLLRGVGSDLRLQDWLFTAIFPREKRMTPEHGRVGNQLAMLEMLRFGVTSFADMYMFIDTCARNAIDSGMRALFCNAFTDMDGGGDRQLAGGLAFYREYHGAGEGRVRVAVGPHAEYTTNPPFIRRVAEALAKLPGDTRVHVHVSETRAEVEACRARNGVSPVRYFHDIGLFRLPTLAAHCVCVDEEDLDILREDGVTVAHNPASNLKLASGVAPVARMLEKGVPVALGTDGAASNNTLNLWEELRLMPLLQKAARLDPTLVSTAQALHSATGVGARALGFADVGEVRAGFRADLILVDTDAPHMTPCHDIQANLVYAAQGADVRLTMVDGRVLYREGEYLTLDRERILYDARPLAAALHSDP